ncbi:MAG: formate dehydrogenase accessory sulfurtransferase FdhD [Myxococcota bacterium]
MPTLENTLRVDVCRIEGETRTADHDVLAVEEPMEIRVGYGPENARQHKSISVTMRTPGDDFELAVGFLFTEGLVTSAEQILSVDFCGSPAPGRAHSNIVRVELGAQVSVDLAKLERNFYATSSCGICGKASLEALNFGGYPAIDENHPMIETSVIHDLPQALRGAQAVFDRTGGLHAAGLFSVEGILISCREDVGRHNAVDKLIGQQVLQGSNVLTDTIMVVSGRTSFEILQKALSVGVPILVAVGAPSSLAVEMAARFAMTLIGFTRDGRYNIYTGAQRILQKGSLDHHA